MDTEQQICRRAATVAFWDGYAKWYKLWMDHTHYHDRVLDVLMTMAEPGWSVVDIGAGNGILSFPLCAIGCDVTAIEPSSGMRSLLYEETFGRGIDWITVLDEPWERTPVDRVRGRDLIIACNSLHLTRTGFDASLDRMFRAGPAHVLVVTERFPGLTIPEDREGYQLAAFASFETDSSFAYHDMDDVLEHWTYKKNRPPYPHEEIMLRSQLTARDDHLWILDRAQVMMFWWSRNDPGEPNRRSETDAVLQ
jgi:hypothetical protein